MGHALLDTTGSQPKEPPKPIAKKAQAMGVRGFDAAMLAGWMKSMKTMYGKEEKAQGKSGAAPHVLTSR